MSSNYAGRVSKTIREHEEWRTKECLNLQAAENRTSQLVRSAFMTDLGSRYADPEKFHKGSRYIDELVAVTEEIARKVFNARYADVRPLSGHTADMAVLFALARPGDRVLSTDPLDGGYPGIAKEGLGGLLGLQNLYFPFDRPAVNINVKGASALIRSEKPSLVFFGSGLMPFPAPVRELSKVTSGTCIYDGSHVLGLIAGGIFQDPLREGCKLLVGSTHKSLPGPQGGIILSNDEEVFTKVAAKTYMGIVDNFHLDRVAALAFSLAEMLQFGRAYAQAVVKNSQAVARGLASRGVRVKGALGGYTESHQVLLDYEDSKLAFIAGRLEQANIISDLAGRIGTSEVTRMGFGPKEMDEVAELVGLVVLGKKPAEQIRRMVRALVREFPEPKYVLKSFPKLLC